MTGRMAITCTLLAVVLMLVTAMPVQAEIVALKRDTTLATKTQAETWGYGNRDAIHDDFWGLTTATAVTVKDAPLYAAGNAVWMNFGASTKSTHLRMLISFDLTGLGSVTSVEKAQLRLATAVCRPTPWIARITSTDWDEGVGSLSYPTTDDPGATWANPHGTGYKLPAWSSWDGGPVGDASHNLSETANGPDMATHFNGTTATANTRGFVVYDVTTIVNDWLVNGAANYGFYAFHHTSESDTRSVFTSEWTGTNESTAVNPVLFIDYVPEPATMGLLGLGFAGMAVLRRRRRRA